MELSLFSVNQNSRKSRHSFSFPFFSFLVRNCFAPYHSLQKITNNEFSKKKELKRNNDKQ